MNLFFHRGKWSTTSCLKWAKQVIVKRGKNLINTEDEPECGKLRFSSMWPVTIVQKYSSSQLLLWIAGFTLTTVYLYFPFIIMFQFYNISKLRINVCLTTQLCIFHFCYKINYFCIIFFWHLIVVDKNSCQWS